MEAGGAKENRTYQESSDGADYRKRTAAGETVQLRLMPVRWPSSGDAAPGLWVGLALIAGGGSTIWLSWMTRREDASPKPG